MPPAGSQQSFKDICLFGGRLKNSCEFEAAIVVEPVGTRTAGCRNGDAGSATLACLPKSVAVTASACTGPRCPAVTSRIRCIVVFCAAEALHGDMHQCCRMVESETENNC